MSKKTCLIYGAYGYTGLLIVPLAVQRGFSENIIIAGRDKTKTEDLAKKYNIKRTAVFSVGDKDIEKHFDGVDVLLNCAGPFVETSQTLLQVCFKKKVHYTDITGEIDVFELCQKHDKQAQDAGVMVIPGIGLDIVPSDCLAKKLSEKLKDATNLEIAFFSSKGPSGVSRGTLKTMLGMTFTGNFSKIRSNGKIINAPPEFKEFTHENKKRNLQIASWGDVSTAYYSTGIPNIKVFLQMGFPKIMVFILYYVLYYVFWIFPFIGNSLIYLVDKNYFGPEREKVENSRVRFVGKVTNNSGKSVELTFETPEGYSLTADSSLRILDKIFKGETLKKSGFLTPSTAFGSGMIDECDGVKMGEFKESS